MSSLSVLLAARAADLLLLIAFVVIGRASHGEDVAGFVLTLLPFLVGLLVGWLLTNSRPPLSPVRTGVLVWLSTVVIGLALRALVGDGVALSFAIVTTLVLAAFLVGWRTVVTLIGRASRRTRV